MTAPAAAPDPGAVEAPRLGALSRLIRDEHDAGSSYQRMADRAYDSETKAHLVSKPYLQKMVQRPPTAAPDERLLRGISLAVRKPLHVVQEAAAEQYFGYKAVQISGYGTNMRRIVSFLNGKPPEEQAKWLAMMEASDQAEGGER